MPNRQRPVSYIPQPNRRTEPEEKPKQGLNWQTAIALVALVVSIVATSISSYYTREQLNQASNQLKLANEQFDSVKVQSQRQAKSDQIREAKQAEIYRKDTLRVAEMNKFQRTSNISQINIYREQLSAFRSQAATSRLLYTAQKESYEQQLNENRAIFYLMDERIDTLKSKIFPELSFIIKNIGKRPATIYTVKLVVLNESIENSYFKPTFTNNKVDANENTSFEIHTEIFKGAYLDRNTIYVLKIEYIDTKDSKFKTVPVYGFTWQKNSNKQFSFNTLRDSDLQRVLKKIAKMGFKFD